MATLDIHPIQAKILAKLLYTSPLKFGHLNGDKISSDKFSFHLNHLLEKQFLEKNDNQQYLLTEKGKKLANKLNTKTLAIQEQGKLAVLILCERTEKRKKEYLVQKRAKQPYRNSYAFIAGKITRGEKIEVAARRQLLEETGLAAGRFFLVGILHKFDINSKSNLLEDKYYFVFTATKCTGTLLATSADGEHTWMTLKEINAISPKLSGTSEALELLKKKNLSFIEKSFVLSDF